MTSFYDLSVGQQTELQRILAGAGMDKGAAERIIKDPSLATRMMAALDAQATQSAPTWYISPERQLATAARVLGVAADRLPSPPVFQPRNATEVLLLHLGGQSFDQLWAAVSAPGGYRKVRWDGLKSDSRHLRLAPSVPTRSRPVWLGFDYAASQGARPDRLWGRPDLTGPEVLSALIQFPDWPLSWFKSAPAPNLSGYQLKYAADWSGMPCLDRWDDDRQLKLDAGWAGSDNADWASPVVREC